MALWGSGVRIPSAPPVFFFRNLFSLWILFFVFFAAGCGFGEQRGPNFPIKKRRDCSRRFALQTLWLPFRRRRLRLPGNEQNDGWRGRRRFACQRWPRAL